MMLELKCLSSILIAFALGAQAELPKMVVDSRADQVRYRCLIGEPPDDAFLKEAVDYLSPSQITVGAIACYRSMWERAVAGPRGGDHCGYDNRLAVIKTYRMGSSPCPLAQEVIKIGSTMVFRRVGKDCRPNVEVLGGGRNPLRLGVRGSSAEIVHLSFAEVFSFGGRKRITVQFFVTAESPPSKDLARAILDSIRAATGIEDLSVDLRSDSWFFNDCSFPALFPFKPSAKDPTPEEYRQSRYAACGAYPPMKTQCFESASRP